MKLTQLTNRKWNYLLIAFFIPVVSIMMIQLCGGYQPFGDRSMLYSDMYHQYYPFFVSFRRALLSGNSLLYNWDVGMGMEYLGLMSYYLASPLNLLSILVPEGWLLGYFSLLVPMKLGFASLFFAFMLKKLFNKNNFSLCVFGAFYGLCAWALGFQWNVMWLDTFALLPLVTLGAIRLLRDKRCVLYTLMLFLSVFANYYIGLFTCIFVLLFFFCYEICRWRSFGRFFADLCRIALFSLLAIGMTAVLELPTLAALQNTQSSVNQFPTTFRLNIADEHTWRGLLDAMRQVAGNVGGGLEPNFKEGLPNLYCGVGMVLLSFLFLTAGEVKLREKICCVVLLLFFMVSFIIRQLDYIWHGFHFTNMIPYRFSFLFSFVVLYMAYRAWLLRDSFKAWQLIVGSILSAGVFMCSDLRTDMVFVAYNIGFLVLYLLTLVYGMNLPAKAAQEDEKKGEEVAEEEDPLTRQLWAEEPGMISLELAEEQAEEQRKLQLRRRSLTSAMLAGIAALEVILNVVNFGIRFPYTSASNYPRGTEAAASIIRYMKEREDEPFYRAEVTHTQTLNDGALNGYYGISTFTSSANVNVTKFMKALGYGAKDTYNRYCFETGSPVANLFLGIKYMIERDTKPVENRYFEQVHYNGNVYLLENTAYLPLGFLAEEALADLEFTSNINCIDFQDQLLQAAAGIERDVWSFVPRSNIAVTGENVTLGEMSSLGRITYTDATASSYIVYDYTVHEDGFLCINLDLTGRNNYTVLKNGVELYKETISLPQLIAISDVVAGDVITVRIKGKGEASGTTTLLAAVMREDVFREAYEKLSRSTLTVTEFETTRVAGTINCDREGLLYTSIPQDGNWSATVDGEPAEITLVGNAMIGVKLTEGEHTVEFTYHNRAFTLGLMISLGSAALFAVIIAVFYPIKRKTGKFERA